MSARHCQAASDQRAPDQRAPDQVPADQRAPDQRAPDQRAPSQTVLGPAGTRPAGPDQSFAAPGDARPAGPAQLSPLHGHRSSSPPVQVVPSAVAVAIVVADHVVPIMSSSPTQAHAVGRRRGTSPAGSSRVPEPRRRALPPAVPATSWGSSRRRERPSAEPLPEYHALTLGAALVHQVDELLVDSLIVWRCRSTASSNATGLAHALRYALTVSGVAVGYFDSSSAARPETTAVACDVPLTPAGTGRRPARSSCSGRRTNPAPAGSSPTRRGRRSRRRGRRRRAGRTAGWSRRWSSSVPFGSLAPTAMIVGLYAGFASVPVTVPSFPAAATTTIPLAPGDLGRLRQRVERRGLGRVGAEAEVDAPGC